MPSTKSFHGGRQPSYLKSIASIMIWENGSIRYTTLFDLSLLKSDTGEKSSETRSELISGQNPTGAVTLPVKLLNIILTLGSKAFHVTYPFNAHE
jgi:hypothetical protein